MNTAALARPSFLVSIALLSVAIGCNTDPAKGKTQATVGSAATAVTAPVAGAVNYAFSNDGSKVEFVGAKVSAKHEGSFAAFRGNIGVVDGDSTKSNVTAEIDIASLTVEPAKLAGHLKSPDFFNAAQFPHAKFTSTAIKLGGDDGASHTVTGNLELHGVTKAISFPAKIKIDGDTVNVDAEFAINRKDFAIVYPGMPDDLIKDAVLIKLALHAKKGA
jgi:polyisoprenoid-binding protein YceI